VVQFYSGRTLSARLSPVVFSFLGHLIILPLTFIVALWWSNGVIRFFPGGGVSAVGYAALIALGILYVVNYFVHMLSLSFAPASVVAPFFNLEPVMTTVVAAAILGERLAANQYAGGGLVLIALVLAGLQGKAKRMWLAHPARSRP
jgi:drug/metabolite transporter (DMT)-like permease